MNFVYLRLPPSGQLPENKQPKNQNEHGFAGYGCPIHDSFIVMGGKARCLIETALHDPDEVGFVAGALAAAGAAGAAAAPPAAGAGAAVSPAGFAAPSPPVAAGLALP